ncbi:MAG TPA: hypothetical protein VMV49_07890 [Candidatus Deferrimicrobium sp.]|nr:hypothetical protein [Candidatus Deferrimicrobium sp.]
MSFSKNAKIGIIFLIILGISVPLITWGVINYINSEKNINWTITLYGSPVSDNATISYQEIMNTSLFTHLINTPINDSNSITYFSGITIWDLIIYSNISYGSANAIRFHSWDGSTSLIYVNLSIVQNNASKVLIVYAENGIPFKGPPKGNGYFRTIVDYAFYAPDCSCAYFTRWLDGIEFIII